MTRPNNINIPSGLELRYWDNDKVTLRVSFTYRGIRCRETLNLEPTPANIRYATNLRGEILNAITKGTFNYPEYFPNSKRARRFGYHHAKVTVAQLLQEYLAQAKHTLEYSSYINYVKVARKHLIPVFGELPIRELTHTVIKRWLIGQTFTAKTAKNILIPLKHVIHNALLDELITHNPLSKIQPTKLLNKATRYSDFKVQPFNLNEVQAILSAAQGQIKNLFQFAFFSGLRTSELLALRWRDIDWEQGIVHTTQARVCKRLKGTKTKAGKREVLLLPPAISALKNQIPFTFKQGRYVFHHPKLNKPWQTDKQIRESFWRPLLKAANVPYRNPYQTRHTYASMMLTKGENILWLAKQMGHVDIEMIIKTYGKWLPDNNQKAGYQPVHDWLQYAS